MTTATESTPDLALAALQMLISEFQARYFQGYVHVTFCTSKFSWGYLTFRRAMSGAPEGDVEFKSVHDACDRLEQVMRLPNNF